MRRLLAPLTALALVAACEDAGVEGGTAELAFEGGALDGSEDEALVAAEAEAAAAAAEREAGDAPRFDPEIEALAASYRTMPIDELLAGMGLARDEATQMMDLPDEVIRELAIARLRDMARDPDDGGGPELEDDGTYAIRYRHLSLDALDDEEFEDAMDALMEGEIRLPAEITALDGKRIRITGYMIPETWNRTKVTDFMLVRDLLACCFGGAPQPDEWMHVAMEPGAGTEYFPFVPVEVTGVLRIVGIDDGQGYAAGAFRLEGDSAREIE